MYDCAPILMSLGLQKSSLPQVYTELSDQKPYAVQMFISKTVIE